MKKIFKIITLIMLIVTIFKISDTYAKYHSKSQADVTQNIGKWIIKVNEMDIYSETGETISFVSRNINAVEDSNTAPRKGITRKSKIYRYNY